MAENKGLKPIGINIKAISGIKDTKVLLEYYSHSTDEGQDQVFAITSL